MLIICARSSGATSATTGSGGAAAQSACGRRASSPVTSVSACARVSAPTTLTRAWQGVM